MIRFLHRIGTKPYKFEFTFEIVCVNLRTDLKLQLLVELKRGSTQIKTNSPRIADVVKGKTFINETIKFASTLYKRPTKNYFQEKIVELFRLN